MNCGNSVNIVTCYMFDYKNCFWIAHSLQGQVTGRMAKAPLQEVRCLSLFLSNRTVNRDLIETCVINCRVIVILYSTVIALLFKSLFLYYLLLAFHSRITFKVNCVLYHKVLLCWVHEKKGEVKWYNCLLNSMYASLPPDFMSMQENWCRRSMWVQ
jgi:hypothetical protein